MSTEIGQEEITLAGGPAGDALQIRQLMEEWQNALCNKDLARLTANYSPGVIFFDVVPPFTTAGAEAYRDKFASFLPYLPTRLEVEQRDLKIEASGDLAFAHCLTRIINADTREAATCGWVRATVCFRRYEGQWSVVHEHVSVPFDPETGRAVMQQGSVPNIENS